MNDILKMVLILSAVAVGIAAIWWFRNRSQRKKIIAGLPVDLPSRFPYVVERFGVPLIESVVPVPDDAVDAIVDGIMIQIQTINAARPNWAAKRAPEDYNVALIDPTIRNQDGSPAIMVRGIQSAGTCIGVANDGHVPTVIILPHQADSNWQYLTYLRDSARHESEHDREWNNDQTEFWAFVGANDVHPHFPGE